MRNITQYQTLSRATLALAAMACIAAVGVRQAHSQEAGAVQMDLAQMPMFLQPAVEPNLMFVFDSSGSMRVEIMPSDTNDRLMGTRFMFPIAGNTYGANFSPNHVPRHDDTQVSNFFVRSAANNKVFYNPDITYLPWVTHTGETMAQADPACALFNPVLPEVGCFNLLIERTDLGFWDSANEQSLHTYWPISYYNHLGGPPLSRASYERVLITADTPASQQFVSPSGVVRSRDEEIQNFANWFQYHRSRALAARASIGRAFANLGEDIRVGRANLHSHWQNIDGVQHQKVMGGVRKFTPWQRQQFYHWLYHSSVNNGGTGLAGTLVRIGEYFQRTDSQGPWSDTPGIVSDEPHLACRQNFVLMMTDGYWTNGMSIGNVDGTAGPVHLAPDGTSYQYVPQPPFADGQGNLVADAAMLLWKHDLRPDLPNVVPTTSRNPAFWQHVVTATIGLGIVPSAVDPDEAFAAIDTGATIDWPHVKAKEPTTGDDVLHAAVNGRGAFFGALDPQAFEAGLMALLNEIRARVEASSTAAAASARVLQTDTLLYTAQFRSTDWSGNLIARQLDGETAQPGAQAWDAEALLAQRNLTADPRRLVTRADGAGVLLDWAKLSDAQREALNGGASGDGLGAARVQWLQGFDAPGLRARDGSGQVRLLGDFVNSDPVYMGPQDYGYSQLPGQEGASYNAYRTSSTYQNRPKVIFIGGNAGMLHAFDASTGRELFGYVPGELLNPSDEGAPAPINGLMAPDYAHRYWVDGTATVGDAYGNWGGSEPSWRSVLVGTMGTGGRSVFALDVTQPGSFGPSRVLWEFTHPELGQGVSQPAITRLRDGRWVAVFGNGYNSASQHPRLFVVDLVNGTLVGTVAVPASTGDATVADGLGPAVVTDWPSGDLMATRAYAGDMQGRVWRFDLSADHVSSWNATRLFTATDAGGEPQPITSAPNVATVPGDSSRLMVLVGTGSYIRPQDGQLDNPQVHSLYGVLDAAVPGAPVTRDQLLEQRIEWQNTTPVSIGSRTYAPHELRAISSHPLTDQPGWVLDLFYADGGRPGERVISQPSFPSGPVQNRVRFSTLMPDEDPCGSGRSGMLMDIDLLSGGAAPQVVFDLNNDGSFGTEDGVAGYVISGVGGVTGERVSPIRVVGTGATSSDALHAGDGRLLPRGRNESPVTGRQSWRQVR